MQYPHVTSGHVEQGAVHLDFLLMKLSARASEGDIRRQRKDGKMQSVANHLNVNHRAHTHPTPQSASKVPQMVDISKA